MGREIEHRVGIMGKLRGGAKGKSVAGMYIFNNRLRRHVYRLM